MLVARGLAQAGARVLLCDRDANDEAVPQSIADEWGLDRVRSVVTDVTQEDDVARAVQVALDAFGRVDVLLKAGTERRSSGRIFCPAVAQQNTPGQVARDQRTALVTTANE